jgi:hypothetical protein
MFGKQVDIKMLKKAKIPTNHDMLVLGQYIFCVEYRVDGATNHFFKNKCFPQKVKQQTKQHDATQASKHDSMMQQRMHKL